MISKFDCSFLVLFLSFCVSLQGQTLREVMQDAKSRYETSSIGRLDLHVFDDNDPTFSESYLYERVEDRIMISTGNGDLILSDSDQYVMVSSQDSLVSFGPSKYLGLSSNPLSFLSDDKLKKFEQTLGVERNGNLEFDVEFDTDTKAKIYFESDTKGWIKTRLYQDYYDAIGVKHVRYSEYSWSIESLDADKIEISSPCAIVDFAADPPYILDERFVGFRVSNMGN